MSNYQLMKKWDNVMSKVNRILFVDDEKRLLQGIKRILWNRKDEWNAEYVDKADQALEKMNESKYDVVVCDLKMPGMNGTAFLSRVMELYPETIRIVLSGQSDTKTALIAVRVAHQYLAKPCEPEKLVETIDNSFKLHNFINDQNMIKLLNHMNNIPSLPSLYVEMMKEINSNNPSLKTIGEIIEKDLAMSAKILQMINSAFFGLPQQIMSPSEAVMLLGLDIIQSLVLTAQVFSQFEEKLTFEFSLEALWNHSWNVGNYVKKILEFENNDKSVIKSGFIAGLLHDIGQVILVSNFVEQYKKTIQFALLHNLPLWRAEIDSFGVTHGQVGAYLLGLWGLPDQVLEAVAFHNIPAYSQNYGFSPLLVLHIIDVYEHEIYVNRNSEMKYGLDKVWLDKTDYSTSVDKWLSICGVTVAGG